MCPKKYDRRTADDSITRRFSRRALPAAERSVRFTDEFPCIRERHCVHCNRDVARGYYVSTPISIRIPDDLASQLDGIARETDRPRSYIVQKALESYLEDYADLQIALDRLHDGTDEVITGKELRKKLGL